MFIEINFQIPAIIKHSLGCSIWLPAAMQSLMRLRVEDVTKHRGTKWLPPQER